MLCLTVLACDLVIINLDLSHNVKGWRARSLTKIYSEVKKMCESWFYIIVAYGLNKFNH